jgi:hypothetical protein
MSWFVCAHHDILLLLHRSVEIHRDDRDSERACTDHKERKFALDILKEGMPVWGKSISHSKYVDALIGNL